MSFRSPIILIVPLFLVMISGLPARAATICTANEGDSTLSCFPWPGKSEVMSVPVEGMPHNVQAVPAKNLFLVTTMEGKVEVLHKDGARITPLRMIEAGHHPAHVIADAAGRNIYVTLSGEDAVAVIDLESGSPVGKIKTGAYPHGLRMSPDGREIYVANINDDSVSVIDVQKREEAARIPVKGKPIQVAFMPDGSKVFVSLSQPGAVAAIDAKTRQVIKVIRTGPAPAQVYADGDLVYVANQGTADNPGHTVTAIDAATLAVKGNIAVGRGPHGINIGNGGHDVFVTNVYDNTVSVIDAKSLAVVDTIPVGAAPNGITSDE